MIRTQRHAPSRGLLLFAAAGLATSARRLIRQPTAQRLVNRVGGSFLIAAGVATVAWRRAAS